ncbi:hypothetical protein [Halobiforma nitratireducens]|uniref:hypothetical protein n=1 Tax=Halobiforma nitratireducens TaxID=130048 RepID=UPI0018730F60|nr:hypothetical protein [Halobiforma nitratireducens]
MVRSPRIGTATEVAVSGAVEQFHALEPLVRGGVGFAGTLLVAMVVLGLVQSRGPKSVAKARRSPIISICIGLPGVLVVVALASTGALILGSSLGTVFGILLVIVGAIVLPSAAMFGFVALGTSIAARLGRDRLPAGVIVGSLLAGLTALSLGSTIVLGTLVASLGLGAGVRVLFNAGGATRPDERTVPPANEI